MSGPGSELVLVTVRLRLRPFEPEDGHGVLASGFDTWGPHKIVARAFARNPASSAVLRPIGLAREGYRPRHLLKWGAYEDVEEFGLLGETYRDTGTGADAGQTSQS